MIDLPAPGTRVSLRYLLPAGSLPPHTDVVGHLVAAGPTARVRTKRGDVVDIAAADVLAVRVVPEVPVRTGEIRNLEHAAALGWPGTEQQWLDGWLLRYGLGSTRRANSAVPLRFTSHAEIVATAHWYASRGIPALISAPDRLFRVPEGVPVDAENLVMASDLSGAAPASEMVLSDRPSESWRAVNRRDVPDDVLTAVVDGDVVFGELAGAAVGRAVVTEAPDGTRWVGLSSVHVSEDARRRGLARALCAGLLDWARGRGATRAYVQVVSENTAAQALYESMGFVVHHRSRYVRAEDLL
ncbi:GNAT family N-acetyltransferase [Mycolicibacterium sp. CR10]|uniref:N-acetylglutamate synthase, CG3035 family n=1 Tax=Mycolicibacterium sp. CR10 TaxID=2562314 RepID=UPI0010C1047D|nr:GNAT family N-acetyltransferase [Mycolicibacterium sp. CR10]